MHRHLHNDQDTEITQKSMDRWMEKEYTHTQTHTVEHYSALKKKKKKEILPFKTMWMDWEDILLSEISQI